MSHKEKGVDHGAFKDSRQREVVHTLDRRERNTRDDFHLHLANHDVLLDKDIVLVDEDTAGLEDFTTLPSPWGEWIGIPLGLGKEDGHTINADKALIHMEFQNRYKFLGGGVRGLTVIFYFPLIGGIWTTPALDWAGRSTQVRQDAGFRGNTNDLATLTMRAGDIWVDVKDNKLWYWKQYALVGVSTDLIIFHIVLKGYRRGVR